MRPDRGRRSLNSAVEPTGAAEGRWPPFLGALPPWLAMVLSSACFCLMAVLVKEVSREMPPLQVVWIRALISLILAVGLARAAGAPIVGRRRKLLLVRGAIGFVALTCYFHALHLLPLGDTVLIHQSYPVWLALLAPLLLRESSGRSTWLYIAISLSGVALVVGPTGRGSSIGGAVAIASAVTSAGAYLAIRELRKTEHPLSVVIAFPAVCVALGMPLALALCGWTWPSPRGWLMLVGVGVATTAGQIFLTHGYMGMATTRAGVLGNLQVLFALIAESLLNRSIPPEVSLLGAALVVAGAVAVTRAQGRAHPNHQQLNAITDSQGDFLFSERDPSGSMESLQASGRAVRGNGGPPRNGTTGTGGG